MSVSIEYYKEHTVEELVQDEYFIKSVSSPDEETDRFWAEFRQYYPEQRKSIEDASSMVRAFKFRPHHPPHGAKERIWESIQATTSDERGAKSMYRKPWLWAAAAAAIILLIASTVLFWPDKETRTLISSQYGEVKQLILPDNSVVTLNANSELEYAAEWKEGQPREVWLHGEGFFEVKHLKQPGQALRQSDRFIVHAEGMAIEVLGTSFNVSDRHSVTKVVLEKGEVRIDFSEPGNNSVVMQPGELVTYDHIKKDVLKETANLGKSISWKRKELALDHTTVEELIRMIEDNYGYTVLVENKDILDRQITGTGTISIEDEQTLFRALEVILQVEISKKGTKLHIRNR